MAAEHYDLYDGAPEQEAANTKKRSRITIDLSPDLRRRIRLAALKSDLSISGYVGEILNETVPKEETPLHRQGRPISREAIERLLRVREKIIEESNGQIFEDSAEELRRAREERTQELMGEL